MIQHARTWKYKKITLRAAEYKDRSELATEIGKQLAAAKFEFDPMTVLRPPEDFVGFDKHRQRMSLKGTLNKYMIFAPERKSILQVLGFGSQTKRYTPTGCKEHEVLFVPKYQNNEDLVQIEAASPVNTRSISSMFVYSDIVDQSLIGNTQANILGFLPIHTNFGDQGYWNFNPPYYTRVRDSRISSIKIQMCQDTGDLMPGAEGKTICRLHFRRVSRYR